MTTAPAPRPKHPPGTQGPTARPDLNRLGEVTLRSDLQRMMDRAAASAGGDPLWRARKLAEGRDLLALSQVCPPGRMVVQTLDLHDDLRAAVSLRVPVPLSPGPDGRLRTADHALVGLVYPRALIAQPVPGTSLACLLWPAHEAFHPNIATQRGQALCFGTQVPVGFPARELVLGAYALLGLQNVMLDPEDPAGVLNERAATWWQARQDLIPLTKTPFFGEDADYEPGEPQR